MAQGSIDAKTLRDMLESGERVTVVDVRKGKDHAEGSIPGSVNFDAYDALHAGDQRALEGLELPEGARVVQWQRSSCGGRDTRHSPWRAEWRLGGISDPRRVAHPLALEEATNSETHRFFPKA